VSGDPAAAVDYLGPPNTALRGHAPFRLVDTDIGTESVVATLGRIEREVSDWSESDGRKIRESMLPSHNTHLHLAEDSMLCDSSLVSSKRPDTQFSTGWRWSPRLKMHVLRPALGGRCQSVEAAT